MESVFDDWIMEGGEKKVNATTNIDLPVVIRMSHFIFMPTIVR